MARILRIPTQRTDLEGPGPRIDGAIDKRACSELAPNRQMAPFRSIAFSRHRLEKK